MTIRNQQLFLDGFWDYGIFDGCFSNPKVKFADIDGFIERNGHYMVLEIKNSGVPVPMGQQITYKSLMDTGLFTILFLFGPRNEPKEMEIWKPDKTIRKKAPTTLEEVKNVIRLWDEWASYNKVVEVKRRIRTIPYVSKYKKVN